MIQFHNVTKIFDTDFKALDAVSLSIQSGEIYGIIGESGAGKSTALRLINGLERPSQGHVEVDGIDINQLSKQQLRDVRQNISVIFQGYNLLTNKTVLENIMLPTKLNHHSDALDLNEILALTKLEDKKHNYPSQLSGGEKQRVAIARALITNPKILICDEPTSALDSKTTTDILSVLRQINQKYQTTIVIVTHELEVAKTLCERVALFEKGILKDVIRVQAFKQKHHNSYVEHAVEVLTQ